MSRIVAAVVCRMMILHWIIFQWSCIVDLDGDGIPNSCDLDSDGDGCSDAVEAGNKPLAQNDTSTFYKMPVNSVGTHRFPATSYIYLCPQFFNQCLCLTKMVMAFPMFST